MKLTAKEITLLAFLSTIVTVTKMALYFLPNVNIVSCLFIIYTLVFGVKRTILIVFVFTTTEILIFGFWYSILGYYIIYSLLVVLTYLFKPMLKDNEYLWGILGAIFAILFGMFFAIWDYFFLGYQPIIRWKTGLLFDAIHMFSNFTSITILYKPIKNTLSKEYSKYLDNTNEGISCNNQYK